MSNSNTESAAGTNLSLRTYILRMLGWSVLALGLAGVGILYGFGRYAQAHSVPGTPAWVGSMQFFALVGSTRVGYEAHALQTGETATHFADARPYTLIWPLTPAGTPWPIVRGGASGPFPRVAWNRGQRDYEWTIEKTLYDLQFRQPESVTISPRRLARPPSSRKTAEQIEPEMARSLLGPITMVRFSLQQLPTSPADVYADCRLALVREPLARLQARYPTIEFYRDPTGLSVALLLTDTSGKRTLIHNKAQQPGNGSTRDYSDPEDRDTIDQILATMVFWGDLASLNVPIIDLPPLPKGAEDE